MRAHVTRKRIVFLAILALVLAAAAIAVAVWQIGGTGAGRSRSSALTPLTFSPNGTTPPADLQPGTSPTGTFDAQVTNANGPLVLRELHQAGPAVSDDESACNGSSYITVPDRTGLTIPVAAGVSEIAVPNTVMMAVSAPTGCQSRTFTVPVSGVFTTP